MGAEYWFDEKAADRVVKFFEVYLVHSKGAFAGQPFLLQDWQKQILRDVFGWKRPDGRRRYRRVYWEIGRGNGKSAIGSGLALYLLTADNEPGAEVYSAAGSAGQASIVFDEARKMLGASPKLTRLAKPYRYSIVVPSTGSTYRVLSADAKLQLGLNAHGIIFDELLTQPNRDLWDALTTSQIKRRQPLCFALTTAGFDKTSICWQLHEHAERVKADPDYDPEFYPVLYCAAADDPTNSEATWRKANPNLGITIELADMKREAERAKREPSYENTFRRLHLCQWVEQSTRWLPMQSWDKCGERAVHAADLRGQECIAGLDLSNISDLTALALVFPQPDKSYAVLPYFFCPRDNARQRSETDNVDYLAWARQGHVELTDGNAIDYEHIRRRISELAGVYKIKELVVDEYNAWETIQHLENAGFTVIPRRTTTYKDMNAPAKELERLVMAGQLAHGNHPVLRWCAENVAVKADAEGNIRPTKAHGSKRIDGVIAVTLALSRAMVIGLENQPMRSVYEGRGVIVF